MVIKRDYYSEIVSQLRLAARHSSDPHSGRLARYVEDHGHSARAAERTLQPGLQAGKRERTASGPDQGMKVELRLAQAASHAFHGFPPAPGAPDMNPPASLVRLADSLHAHAGLRLCSLFV